MSFRKTMIDAPLSEKSTITSARSPGASWSRLAPIGAANSP
jgi:hypothetical protein